MKENFPLSLKLVLQSEGGNVDNPADKGGRTSRGITQRVYDAYRVRAGKPLQDVYLASDDEVSDIYHQSYWWPTGDRLPAGVDYLYFDMAVNAGPHRSVLLLQRAAEVYEVGVIGPVTMAEIDATDPTVLIQKFTEARKEFYQNLHEGLFLHGWLNRADASEKAALAMIGGQV